MAKREVRKNRALSLEELAAQWGVSKWTPLRLIRAKKLKAHRIGRQFRVFESDVREYLSRHATAVEAA